MPAHIGDFLDDSASFQPSLHARSCRFVRYCRLHCGIRLQRLKLYVRFHNPNRHRSDHVMSKQESKIPLPVKFQFHRQFSDCEGEFNSAAAGMRVLSFVMHVFVKADSCECQAAMMVNRSRIRMFTHGCNAGIQVCVNLWIEQRPSGNEVPSQVMCSSLMIWVRMTRMAFTEQMKVICTQTCTHTRAGACKFGVCKFVMGIHMHMRTMTMIMINNELSHLRQSQRYRVGRLIQLRLEEFRGVCRHGSHARHTGVGFK